MKAIAVRIGVASVLLPPVMGPAGISPDFKLITRHSEVRDRAALALPRSSARIGVLRTEVRLEETRLDIA